MRLRLAPLAALFLFAACPSDNPMMMTCTTGGLNCPCTAAADCSSGFRCNNDQCKPPGGTTCTASADCATGNYCSVTGRCMAVGAGGTDAACSSDADCSQDLRCDMRGLTGRCSMQGQGDVGESCSLQTDCLAGLFCGGNKCQAFGRAFPANDNQGATCTDEGGFRAYFEVPRPSQPPKDFYRLPFPNDIRVSSAGALSLPDFYLPASPPFGINFAKIYVDALVAGFEGFSPNAPVTLRFSKDLGQQAGFDSLQDATQLIDLTAQAPVTVNFAYTAQKTKWSCANRLSVQPPPDEPMIGGHTYAAVVTTAVRSSSNETPVQDPDLVVVLGASRPGDPSLGAAWDAYLPLRTYLLAHPTEVATAAVFTVADTNTHMQKVAAAVAAEAAPTLSAITLCGAGVTSPCADGSAARVCGDDSAFFEVQGKISMPIYQQGTAPYLTAGGNIMESGGAAVKVRSEDVCFSVSIPKAGTMPGAGWPLVVFAHGTGGSFRDYISNGVASTLAVAATPTAVFSFEGVGHGARRGGSTRDPADIVYNVLNPPAARDVWLQGAADVLTALKVAGITQAVPSGPTLDFDPAKTAFFGHSQGATTGELALAFTDAARAVVLSGAGAYLSEALAHKTSPFDVPDTMRAVLGDSIDAFHPVVTLVQTYFDRSDPLTLAPLIIRRAGGATHSKHVYMSWGTGDTYAPLATLEFNARGLGLKPVSPILEQIEADNMSLGTPISRPNITNDVIGGNGTVTAAVFQYAPGSGDGHFVAFQNATSKADWVAFLTSYFATGTPLIP
jgi:predicted esterase